jgi:hypothetical protein
MSDHDAAPHPIDKAYAQAEAMLDDEAARAARRARVLAAVAGQAEAEPIRTAPPRRRVSWTTGGWLAAASVAGVSALVAFQLTAPPAAPRRAPPAQTAVAANPAPAPATAVDTAAPAPPAAPQTRAPSPDGPGAVSSPAPPSQPAAVRVAGREPEPLPAEVRAPADSVEALVVTGAATPPPAAPPPSVARAARAESAMAQAPAAAPPADRSTRLHAAATAGRLTELTALLAQGALVDALDSDRETALMKAIQARSPSAAALLRRHGASLDRLNRNGVSARDMAAAIDDPELNRALGLGP